MFQIKDLLNKFKDLEDPKELRNKIAKVINDLVFTNFNKELDEIGPITEKNIEINKNIVRISAHPTLKHKIFISKALCIQKLAEYVPDSKIIDIR